MVWAITVLRVLVGAAWFMSGLNYFVPMFDTPAKDGVALEFLKILGSTDYMSVVKVFETAGGLLILTGRWTPLGITLVMPVAVNVMLFELFLVGAPGPGCLLTALLVLLILGYLRYFLPVLLPYATAERSSV